VREERTTHDGNTEKGQVLEAVLLSGLRSDDRLLNGSEVLPFAESGQEPSGVWRRAREKEKP